MEDSDNDSGLDDPVVRMRRPKNCTDVRTRYMALNAEGIRVVREMESMINIESGNVESLKALLILHMLESVNEDEDSIDLSSLSSSSEDSMTTNDDLTPCNSSYSGMSSSISCVSSDEETIDIESHVYDYEERLIIFSLMTNTSIEVLDMNCCFLP